MYKMTVEDSYWDGPVAGVVVDSEGKRYYFVMEDECWDNYHYERIFGLYDLSDEDWKKWEEDQFQDKNPAEGYSPIKMIKEKEIDY